ncbi:MAG: YbbR-like domain-containing protein [Candidatus Cloacimonetes bacterium]|nr:YbbR-like domain-containing protein [Candidatus Cloacimonadota bacterium]
MKRNFLLKLLVFLLAVFLWFQQVLLREHTQEVPVPIHFVDIPSDLVLVNNDHPRITILFQGRGLDFLVLKLANPYLEINAADFTYGANSFQISVNNLENEGKLEAQIEPGQLADITAVWMDRIVEEKKPIKIIFASAGDEEFFIKNKIDNPQEKVDLKGPASILNDIAEIQTEPVSQKMLKSGKITAKLIPPDNRVQLLNKNVILEVTQSQVVTRTISLIPVSYPLEMNISIIPQKVSVMIRGPKELIDDLETTSIRAYIDPADLRNLKSGKKHFAPVSFALPAGVKLVEYTPQQIQVILND